MLLASLLQSLSLLTHVHRHVLECSLVTEVAQFLAGRALVRAGGGPGGSRVHCMKNDSIAQCVMYKYMYSVGTSV